MKRSRMRDQSSREHNYYPDNDLEGYAIRQRSRSESDFALVCPCLVCITVIAVVVLAFGSYMIEISKNHVRDNQIKVYLDQEKAWNETYEQELRGVEIALIKNHTLFKANEDELKQLLQMISSEKFELGNLKNKLEGSTDEERPEIEKQIENLNQSITENTERLDILHMRESELKWPLSGEEFAKDAHRLNIHSKHEQFPEYNPFAQVSKDFNIVELYGLNESLVQKDEKSGELKNSGIVVLNESLVTTSQQFEHIYSSQKGKNQSSAPPPDSKKLTSLYIELTDKTSRAQQILEIPQIQLLKAISHKITTKKSQWKNHCNNRNGKLVGNICTELYWATEFCISIAKNAQTSKWYLDSNRYNQSSFGCGFHVEEDPVLKHFDHPVDNVQAWQKFRVDRLNRNHEYLFPLHNLIATFRIRHGGDPLQAVVNLSNAKNHLTFDQSSQQQFVIGIVLMSIGGIVLLYTFYKFLKLVGALSWLASLCKNDSHERKRKREQRVQKQQSHMVPGEAREQDDLDDGIRRGQMAGVEQRRGMQEMVEEQSYSQDYDDEELEISKAMKNSREDATKSNDKAGMEMVQNIGNKRE